MASVPSRTRCILIGIDYPGTSAELRGCVNDAENLAECLISTGTARESDITILREATGRQIWDAIADFANSSYGCEFDSLFVSFSGHGVSMRDRNGDEDDGFDECLCPSDYATRGVLRDDELARLFARISPDVSVRVVMDCCHSGTSLDLPYAYVGFGRTASTSSCGVSSTAPRQHPDIMTLSGCRDDQTSADAYHKGRREFTGAMTSALLDVLSLEPELGRNAFALLASIRILLVERKMTQVPQLASSFKCSGPIPPVFIV